MSKLIGIIYSQLLAEFGLNSKEDLWLISENIAERIIKQKPKLNENQQNLLGWLKTYSATEAVMPIDTVARFWVTRNQESKFTKWAMNAKQQAQVLQAFASWVLEQEES